MDLSHVKPSLLRLWAEEVLYLHSLWHQGPPQNPNPSLSSNPNPSSSSNPVLRPIKPGEFKKKKKIKNKSQPSDLPAPEIEWPVKSTPDPDAEPAGWPDPTQNHHPRAPLPALDQARANALWIQQTALKSCRDFFLKDGSGDDGVGMSEDEEEEESTAFEFFLGIFKNDGELRGYYEKNYEKGEFLCLVCGGTGVKLRKRYGNCVALVQHLNAISKTQRRGAHRGFGQAVCRVLGWDFKRLPNIVPDLGEPLGQSLTKSTGTQEEFQKKNGMETVEISDDNVEKDESNRDLVHCIKVKETEIPTVTVDGTSKGGNSDIEKETADSCQN